MEISKLLFAGILTVVMALSSGTTLYIQDEGSATGCRAGWEPYTSGELEGYYKCVTATAVRTELCYEVYDSANTPNYWCRKGKLAEAPSDSAAEAVKVNANGKSWQCPIDNGEVGSYTKCISDKNTEGYLGELI